MLLAVHGAGKKLDETRVEQGLQNVKHRKIVSKAIPGGRGLFAL